MESKAGYIFLGEAAHLPTEIMPFQRKHRQITKNSLVEMKRQLFDHIRKDLSSASV